jgi:hypothetical protein
MKEKNYLLEWGLNCYLINICLSGFFNYWGFFINLYIGFYNTKYTIKAVEILIIAPIKIDTSHLSLNVWTIKFESKSPEICPALAWVAQAPTKHPCY